MLLADAVLADGQREVLAGALGSREFTRAWTDLLEDLTRPGLRVPLLIITDGGPGLLAAIAACFPEGPRQHWTTHKLANVLEKVPKGVQAEVGDTARRVLDAPTRAQAEEAWRLFQRASRHLRPFGGGLAGAGPGGLLDLLPVSREPLEADSHHERAGAQRP